jgi:hypothetical protein
MSAPKNIQVEHVDKGNQYQKLRVKMNGITRGYVEQDTGVTPDYAYEAKKPDGTTVISTQTPIKDAVADVLADDTFVPASGTFDPVSGNLTVTFNVAFAAATGVDGFTVKAGASGTWNQKLPVNAVAGDTKLIILMLLDSATPAAINAFSYTKAGAAHVSQATAIELVDFADFPMEII